MSSRRYQAVRNKLSAKQHDAILNCWMSAVNHDGHAWVTWTAVEELIATLFEEEGSDERKRDA